MVSCSQDGGQSKNGVASFGQSGITPKIMVEIANLVHRGTLRPTSIFVVYFDLGVTSHDLSLRGEFENGGKNLKTIFKFPGGGIWDGGI